MLGLGNILGAYKNPVTEMSIKLNGRIVGLTVDNVSNRLESRPSDWPLVGIKGDSFSV